MHEHSVGHRVGIDGRGHCGSITISCLDSPRRSSPADWYFVVGDRSFGCQQRASGSRRDRTADRNPPKGVSATRPGAALAPLPPIRFDKIGHYSGRLSQPASGQRTQMRADYENDVCADVQVAGLPTHHA